MREENDWRLTNQGTYLKGAQLWWKRYAPHSDSWDHEHCEFCWAKFMDEDAPDVLREGYATGDGDRWICEECYDDFKDLFQWEVIRAKETGTSDAI